MRRKALAWLSTLLIVTGILLPAVTVVANHQPGSWSVTSSGPEYDSGNTIFTYTVAKTGDPHNLSHLSLALCEGFERIAATPSYQERGPDPTTGMADALKWEAGVTDGTTIRVQYAGIWPSGTQAWAVKTGTTVYSGTVEGPSCAAGTVDFAVQKSVGSAGQSSLTLEGGGTVDYFYTIVNTGNLPFTIETAVDDVLGPVSFSPTTVQPGGSATGSASKTFPALTMGSTDQVETNTITATVNFEGDSYGPKAAQATVVNRAPAEQPDFSIVKTVSSANAPSPGQTSIMLPLEGGTANYLYTLTNTGNVPLTIFSATDDRLGNLTFAPNPVPVGGTATATASKYFAPLAPGSDWLEEINTVSVSAGTASATAVTKTATATVELPAPDPRRTFTVTKLVSTVNDLATAQASVTLTGGGTAYYFYTVTNNGNVPITIHSAEDDVLGTLTFTPATIPVGGTATATATKTFASLAPGSGSETEINTVTVTAAWNGDPFGTKTATATVVNNAPPPPPTESSFTLTKQVSATGDAGDWHSSITLTGGGTAHYLYTITNTGDTALRLVSATDDKLGALSFTPTTLSPGESATASMTKTFVNPAAVETETNIATVVMADATTELEPMQATASVTNQPQRTLTFTVTKTVSATNNPATGSKALSLSGGGTAYYFYTFTNTSSVPLFITTATDDVLGDLTFTPEEVPAGGTATATASKVFAAPAIGAPPLSETNIVSVTAENDGLSAGPMTDTATVLVYGDSANLDFTLTKRVSTTNNPATGQASITLQGGGTAHYFYTLTNTGNVPLSISTAVDDRLGPLAFTPATVAPGGTATAHAAKSFATLPYDTPDQTEVNTATVTAEWNSMAINRSAQAAVINRAPSRPQPPEDHPSFRVSKTVSTTADPATGQGSVTLTGGGTVHYFYTITNTGDVPLTVHSATDDRLGALSFSPATIHPGATATATASKTFASLPAGTAAEVETNTLTVRMAHGTALIGPRTAQATVTNNPVPARPGFRLEKLASTTNDPATGSTNLTLTGGGTVYYFYTVTNTGNVPITITSAVDDKLGPVAFAPLTLASGASATATKSKVFPAAPSATSETNVVTVRAVAGNEVMAEQKATAVVHATPERLGSVEVRVLDGSTRHGGATVPIAGAAITFDGGRTGVTDANGRVSFLDLPFGSYSAIAESADPLHAGSEVKSGGGTATISQSAPNGVITIVLAWEYRPSISVAICQTFGLVGGVATATGPGGTTVQATAPGPDGRYLLEGLSAGTWTVTLTAPGLAAPVSRDMNLRVDESVPRNAYTLDFSSTCPATTGTVTGTICSPKQPGAQIAGEGPDGRTATAFVAYDGTVGKVRSFVMNDLVPGLWKLTLQSPGRPAVSRSVTVVAGQTVETPAFALACTGTPAPSPWGSYGAGALLVLAGLGLRWFIRRRPV